MSARFGFDMPVDALRLIIARPSEFRVIKGDPMDALRLKCDAAEIAEYSNTLRASLDNLPVVLLTNADDTGHYNWRHTQKGSLYPEITRVLQSESRLTKR
jgi:hypothetical protein